MTGIAWCQLKSRRPGRITMTTPTMPTTTASQIASVTRSLSIAAESTSTISGAAAATACTSPIAFARITLSGCTP